VGAAGTRIFGCATEEACYAYVLEQEPLRPPCSTMRGLLVVYVTGLSSTQVEYLHGCQAQTRTFYVVDQERSAAFRRNFSEPRYWVRFTQELIHMFILPMPSTLMLSKSAWESVVIQRHSRNQYHRPPRSLPPSERSGLTHRNRHRLRRLLLFRIAFFLVITVFINS
jgi:hypothetical protein